jgi:hypothetical protein
MIGLMDILVVFLALLVFIVYLPLVGVFLLGAAAIVAFKLVGNRDYFDE